MDQSNDPAVRAAGAGELLALAREYRRAAEAQMDARRKGEPLSQAPARLCAIHAVELFLTAFLCRNGWEAARIRAHQHRLGPRALHAAGHGLVLDGRTLAHLARLDEEREYLVARYVPARVGQASQVNRMLATLTEVATKVEGAFGPAAARGPVGLPRQA